MVDANAEGLIWTRQDGTALRNRSVDELPSAPMGGYLTPRDLQLAGTALWVLAAEPEVVRSAAVHVPFEACSLV